MNNKELSCTKYYYLKIFDVINFTNYSNQYQLSFGNFNLTQIHNNYMKEALVVGSRYILLSLSYIKEKRPTRRHTHNFLIPYSTGHKTPSTWSKYNKIAMYTI